MINYKSLLIDRIESILYVTTNLKTNNALGWIGGNPPEYFDNHLISKENHNYSFYLSLLNPFDEERMISIFIPDYDSYLEHDIYPDCSIKVFEHPTTQESELSNLKSSFMIDKKYIVESRICNTNEAINIPYLIKFGGTPDFIQQKEYYYKNLDKDAFKFLFQIDERGYPDGLIKGNYPFNFGGLYIYANITWDSFSNPIAGFWQYT